MINFKDKTLLITGGTGSFGNAVLNRFLETDIKEIQYAYYFSGLGSYFFSCVPKFSAGK